MELLELMRTRILLVRLIRFGRLLIELSSLILFQKEINEDPLWNLIFIIFIIYYFNTWGIMPSWMHFRNFFCVLYPSFFISCFPLLLYFLQFFCLLHLQWFFFLLLSCFLQFFFFLLSFCFLYFYFFLLFLYYIQWFYLFIVTCFH